MRLILNTYLVFVYIIVTEIRTRCFLNTNNPDLTNLISIAVRVILLSIPAVTTHIFYSIFRNPI